MKHNKAKPATFSKILVKFYNKWFLSVFCFRLDNTIIPPPSYLILGEHTCDKFQKGIREIFLSFQGGFSKMHRTYRKILEGDFEILVKSGMF